MPYSPHFKAYRLVTEIGIFAPLESGLPSDEANLATGSFLKTKEVIML